MRRLTTLLAAAAALLLSVSSYSKAQTKLERSDFRLGMNADAFNKLVHCQKPITTIGNGVCNGTRHIALGDSPVLDADVSGIFKDGKLIQLHFSGLSSTEDVWKYEMSLALLKYGAPAAPLVDSTFWKLSNNSIFELDLQHYRSEFVVHLTWREITQEGRSS